MGVNSLPKTVTRQRCDCDLNPGHSAPESSTLTTRLPNHPGQGVVEKIVRLGDRQTPLLRCMLCIGCTILCATNAKRTINPQQIDDLHQFITPNIHLCVQHDAPVHPRCMADTCLSQQPRADNC